MKKIIALLLLLVGIGFAVLVVTTKGRSPGTPSLPELTFVGTSQVTLSWRSSSASIGTILYRASDSDDAPLEAREASGPSEEHEVTISGLSASKRYIYWIKGTERRYYFQTQPLPTTPFSFLFVWGEVSHRMGSWISSELPEFVVSLAPVSARGAGDPFANIRPSMPIFSLSGIHSPFLASMGKNPAGPHGLDRRAGWKLDWGGLRLIFLNRAAAETGGAVIDSSLSAARDPESAGKSNQLEALRQTADWLDGFSGHTIGLVAQPGFFFPRGGDKASQASPRRPPGPAHPNAETHIRGSALHQLLLEHNNRFSIRPAAFVLIPSEHRGDKAIDGVQYVWVFAYPPKEAEGPAPSGAARIDVSVEFTRAVFLDEGREVTLRQPPLAKKRSCEECRRLADQGAYEESIQAYRLFIQANKGHYQIDDAYFGIAEILDEKLFRFQDALAWYQRLLQEFPTSNLAPLARQRTDYLNAYRDHQFEPLARFERIRRIEYARNQHSPTERVRLLNRVRATIKEFPDSSIAPLMQYWLANQYRQSDPDRAVSEYVALMNRYPQSPKAVDAMMEIGETYYNAGRYQEALAAYGRALKNVPSKDETIQSQIRRAKRNLRREHLAWFCWLTLGLIFILGLWGGRRVDIPRYPWWRSIGTFVVLGVLLSLGGWLIQEEFSSGVELFSLAAGFSASASFAYPFTKPFADKLMGSRNAGKSPGHAVGSALVGAFLGLFAFAAGLYLTLFYTNEHYLIIAHL